jgi:hypothetical protein
LILSLGSRISVGSGWASASNSDGPTPVADRT